MFKKTLICTLLLGCSTWVNAGTLTCTGKITQVNYHSPDTFMIQLDSMNAPVFFCHPNSTFTVPGTTYSTSAETCRAMVGIFMAAKLADRTLAVMYFDGDGTPSSCNGWSSWQSANIRYFNWAD